MTSADTDSIGVVEDSQRLENLVVVGKRLALAHEDNARDTLAKVVGYMKYLVDDLLSGQRALEAVEAGSAKAQPMPQPAWVETQTESLLRRGIPTASTETPSWYSTRYLRAIFGNLLG